MPITYPPDPEPAGYDAHDQPSWHVGRFPAAIPAVRRVTRPRETALSPRPTAAAGVQAGRGHQPPESEPESARDARDGLDAKPWRYAPSIS